jgi:hypothetical protein
MLEDAAAGGIRFCAEARRDAERGRQAFSAVLAGLGLDRHVTEIEVDGALCFRLNSDARQEWLPEFDTLDLAGRLGLDVLTDQADQEREILLAMLGGPVAFEYRSYAELESAVRIRRNVANAARKTALAFDPAAFERPAEYWTYAEGRGFILLPEKSLVEALRLTTQPEVSGTLYSFSCYRATEYVILLGIAQELEGCNPCLLDELEQHWRRRAIMSGQFHDVFLREYGSMDQPLPPRYYVPGDRLWFRNPDEASSDVTGYEGSWVFYQGGGLFSNFWKRDRPYSIESKCIEMFHWRHATFRDADGRLRIDEAIVDERVRATMENPVARHDIVRRMMRYRDPRGVYHEGGCIDTTREYPRCVWPGTADLLLPELQVS